MGERLLCTQEVRGSSPLISTFFVDHWSLLASILFAGSD